MQSLLYNLDESLTGKYHCQSKSTTRNDTLCYCFQPLTMSLTAVHITNSLTYNKGPRTKKMPRATWFLRQLIGSKLVRRVCVRVKDIYTNRLIMRQSMQRAIFQHSITSRFQTAADFPRKFRKIWVTFITGHEVSSQISRQFTLLWLNRASRRYSDEVKLLSGNVIFVCHGRQWAGLTGKMNYFCWNQLQFYHEWMQNCSFLAISDKFL